MGSLLSSLHFIRECKQVLDSLIVELENSADEPRSSKEILLNHHKREAGNICYILKSSTCLRAPVPSLRSGSGFALCQPLTFVVDGFLFRLLMFSIPFSWNISFKAIWVPWIESSLIFLPSEIVQEQIQVQWLLTG